MIVVTVTSPYEYRVQLKTLYITKKQAIAEFKRNFGSFRGFVKKEWELV